MYKKRLDHIYDLCRVCKARLNNHLRGIDLQIGNDLLRQRNPQNGNLNNQRILNKKFQNETNLKIIEKTQKIEDKATFCDNLKSISRKAYTIAGTVPNYVFKTSPRKDYKYEISPASVLKENLMDEDMSFNNSNQNESVNEKPKEKAKKVKIKKSAVVR